MRIIKEKPQRSENAVDGDQGDEIHDYLCPKKREIVLGTGSGLGYFSFLHFSKGNKYFLSNPFLDG